jgi:quinol monooxygenase YgiN
MIPYPISSSELLNVPREETVKDESVDKVKAAITEFVDYVRQSEPSTWFYAAWQAKSDRSKFVHLFTFEDERAHERHGQSEAVKRFESVYQPELIGGPVVFSDYRLIATNGGTTR